jgi:hypothetical protein
MSRERASMEGVPMVEEEEGGGPDVATRRSSSSVGATPRPSEMLTGETPRCTACLRWGPEQYDCSGRPTTSNSAHPPAIDSSLEDREVNRLANLDLGEAESDSDQPLEMICPPRLLRNGSSINVSAQNGSNSNTQSQPQPSGRSQEGSHAASESPTMMFRMDHPS